MFTFIILVHLKVVYKHTKRKWGSGSRWEKAGCAGNSNCYQRFSNKFILKSIYKGFNMKILWNLIKIALIFQYFHVNFTWNVQFWRILKEFWGKFDFEKAEKLFWKVESMYVNKTRKFREIKWNLEDFLEIPWNQTRNLMPVATDSFLMKPKLT